MRQASEVTFVNIGQLWMRPGQVIDGPVFIKTVQGRVRSIGPMTRVGQVQDAVDVGGRAVIPGLVEAHTHMVFAGERANEFEMRAQGVSYEQIARQGGGIRSTVAATRKAGEQELFESGMNRLDRFMAMGVTTIEVKSGYGLDFEQEMRMLRVIRRLNEAHPLTVRPTLLAHVPYGADRKEMVMDIAQRWIPEAAKTGLAVQFDVFCDAIAFDFDEAARLLRAARDAGLGLRVHAEQLGHTGISKYAASIGAQSADHLDHVQEDDIVAMAGAGTVAVLLPGCSISMGTRNLPHIRPFKAHGVAVALSTDYNPGSSVTVNLPLMGSLAVAYMGFSYDEAMAAITTHAAKVLGMADTAGSIQPGRPADFVVLDCADFRQLFYEYATPHVASVYKNGVKVYEACGSGHGRPQ